MLVSKSTTRVIKTRLQEKRVRGIGPEAAFQETRLPYGCPTRVSNWAAMASNSLHSSWIACISAGRIVVSMSDAAFARLRICVCSLAACAVSPDAVGAAALYF